MARMWAREARRRDGGRWSSTDRLDAKAMQVKPSLGPLLKITRASAC